MLVGKNEGGQQSVAQDPQQPNKVTKFVLKYNIKNVEDVNKDVELDKFII